MLCYETTLPIEGVCPIPLVNDAQMLIGIALWLCLKLLFDHHFVGDRLSSSSVACHFDETTPTKFANKQRIAIRDQATRETVKLSHNFHEQEDYCMSCVSWWLHAKVDSLRKSINYHQYHYVVVIGRKSNDKVKGQVFPGTMGNWQSMHCETNLVTFSRSLGQSKFSNKRAIIFAIPMWLLAGVEWYSISNVGIKDSPFGSQIRPLLRIKLWTRVKPECLVGYVVMASLSRRYSEWSSSWRRSSSKNNGQGTDRLISVDESWSKHLERAYAAWLCTPKQYWIW